MPIRKATIRTVDYEEEERAEIASKCVQLLLASCSMRHTGYHPKVAATKFIARLHRLVTGNQVTERQEQQRAARFAKEVPPSEEDVELVEAAGTLDGSRLAPYGMVRLLAYLLRLQRAPGPALLDTIEKMKQLVPTTSLVDACRPTRLLPGVPLEEIVKAGGGLGNKKRRRRRQVMDRNAALEQLAAEAALGKAATFSVENDEFVDAIVKDHTRYVQSRLRRGGVNLAGMHTLLLYGPLHAAADFGRKDMVELLLDQIGVEVNGKCIRKGRTALHYAAENGHIDICKLLLKAGARVAVVDTDGKRPSEVAASSAPLLRAARKQLINILADVPRRVPAIYLSESGPTSLNVNWVEPIWRRHQVPIDSYRVEWRALEPQDHGDGDDDERGSLGTASSSSIVPFDFEPDPLETLRQSSHRRIKFNDDDDNDMTKWSSAITTTRSHEIVDLLSSSDYIVRVRAHNAAGFGLPSRPPARLMTAEGPPDPPGPCLLVARFPSAVTLVWDAPERDNGFPILGYEIQRCNVVEFKRGEETVRQRGQWSQGEELHNPLRFFLSSNIAPNGRVVFRVRARNKLGYGPWGPDSECFQVDQSVRLVEAAPWSLTLTWDVHPRSKLYGYELQMRTLAPGAEEGYQTVANDIDVPKGKSMRQCQYVVKGLLPATNYLFRLRHLDHNGWQHWSVSLQSAILKTSEHSPEPPTAPWFIRVSGAGDYGCGLQWAPNACNGPAIVEYEVIMTKREAEWFIAGRSKGTEPTLIVKGLQAGKAYTFRVRARNKLGWSSFGPPSDSYFVQYVPAPGRPKVLGFDRTSAELEWSPPNVQLTIEKYEVAMRLLRKAEERCEEFPTTRAKVTGLRATAQYTFRVRALSILGWSAWSEESEVVATSRRM